MAMSNSTMTNASTKHVHKVLMEMVIILPYPTSLPPPIASLPRITPIPTPLVFTLHAFPSCHIFKQYVCLSSIPLQITYHNTSAIHKTPPPHPLPLTMLTAHAAYHVSVHNVTSDTCWKQVIHTGNKSP